MEEKTPVTLEQARDAKLEIKKWLDKEGIVYSGIGLTKRAESGYALQVNVPSGDKLSTRIPKFINGVMIVVEVTGKIRKLH